MSTEETAAVKAAKEIVAGRSADLREIFEITRRLKIEKEFRLLDPYDASDDSRPANR